MNDVESAEAKLFQAWQLTKNHITVEEWSKALAQLRQGKVLPAWATYGELPMLIGGYRERVAEMPKKELPKPGDVFIRINRAILEKLDLSDRCRDADIRRIVLSRSTMQRKDGKPPYAIAVEDIYRPQSPGEQRMVRLSAVIAFFSRERRVPISRPPTVHNPALRKIVESNPKGAEIPSRGGDWREVSYKVTEGMVMAVKAAIKGVANWQALPPSDVTFMIWGNHNGRQVAQVRGVMWHLNGDEALPPIRKYTYSPPKRKTRAKPIGATPA
jgi:hypothetical protein